MNDEVQTDAGNEFQPTMPLEEIPPLVVEPAPPRPPQAGNPFLKIPVTVQVVLGRKRMPLAEVMAFGPGSVIVLDQELSQPVSLEVNGSEVARGTLSVVDEATGQLGITLTEIAATPQIGNQR